MPVYDGLQRLMRDLTASKIYNRNRGLTMAQPGQGPMPTNQQGMGFTVRPTETISAGPGDETAWNNKVKNRALYGRYGKGGLMRDQMKNATEIQGLRNKGDLAVEGARQSGLNTRQSQITDTANRELDARYNTDTFGGKMPGADVIKANAEKLRAEAAMKAAGRGLKGAQKIFQSEALGKDDPVFYQQSVDPETGQPIMIPLPIRKGQGSGLMQNMPMPSGSATPARQNMGSSKQKKDPNDYRSYLGY
jgi:hypothetical protein